MANSRLRRGFRRRAGYGVTSRRAKEIRRQISKHEVLGLCIISGLRCEQMERKIDNELFGETPNATREARALPSRIQKCCRPFDPFDFAQGRTFAQGKTFHRSEDIDLISDAPSTN